MNTGMHAADVLGTFVTHLIMLHAPFLFMGGVLPQELVSRPSRMPDSSSLPVREHMPGHHTSIHLPIDAQKMSIIQQKKCNACLMYTVLVCRKYLQKVLVDQDNKNIKWSYIFFPLDFICSLDGQHMHSSQAAFSTKLGSPLHACEKNLTYAEGDHARTAHTCS